MKGLTKKQRDILDYIEDYVSANRYSPSYREIGDHFGFSSLGSVYNHLHSLKKKGVICFEPRSARSLIPEKQGNSSSFSMLPLIGTLKLGMPPSLFSQSQLLACPSFLIPKEECYLLRIEGEGSAEDSIQSGDLLIFSSRVPSNGEMALSLVNKHTSLIKRVFFESPYIRFEASISDVQPILLREDHVQIQGTLIGLIRSYTT